MKYQHDERINVIWTQNEFVYWSMEYQIIYNECLTNLTTWLVHAAFAFSAMHRQLSGFRNLIAMEALQHWARSPGLCHMAHANQALFWSPLLCLAFQNTFEFFLLSLVYFISVNLLKKFIWRYWDSRPTVSLEQGTFPVIQHWQHWHFCTSSNGNKLESVKS